MAEDARSNLVEAEVINPAALTPFQRDAFFQDLFLVHEKIFAGSSLEEFTHDLLRPGALRTRIQIYRSEAGELVGYCAVHLMELRTGLRRRAVLRAEAGLLPDYRGTASTLWFGAKEAFRFKMLHPIRSVVFMAVCLHPSSYHLISKYFWRCYPYPSRRVPAKWQRLLLELAQTSGLQPADPDDPLILDADWITRDSPADVENWRNSPFEDVKYFLSRNPGYSKGYGLTVIAPLYAGNLFISFIQYIVHSAALWLRG